MWLANIIYSWILVSKIENERNIMNLFDTSSYFQISYSNSSKKYYLGFSKFLILILWYFWRQNGRKTFWRSVPNCSRHSLRVWHITTYIDSRLWVSISKISRQEIQNSLWLDEEAFFVPTGRWWNQSFVSYSQMNWNCEIVV